MVSVCCGKERAIHEGCKWGLALGGTCWPGSGVVMFHHKERRPAGGWTPRGAAGSLRLINGQQAGWYSFPPEHHQSRSPGLLGMGRPTERARW